MSSRLPRAAIVAIVLGLFVRTFLVETFEIESASMSPTLLPGDHVLVNRLIYAGDECSLLPQRSVRRGDVVAVRRPVGTVLVKRVAALPGEVLELREGRLFVDGRAEVSPPAERMAERVHPIRLRSEEIYLLGDHRSRSRDSRHWGPARERWLRGRVMLIYWSSRRPETASGGQGVWDKMLSSAWLKIRSTRWDRWMRPVR